MTTTSYTNCLGADHEANSGCTVFFSGMDWVSTDILAYGMELSMYLHLHQYYYN